MKTSDFKANVDAVLREHKSIKGVQKYFRTEISNFPVEKKILYPGKLYTFKYVSDTTKLFDTFPYIISLGPSKKSNYLYSGIDLRYIPFTVRVDLMANIYQEFGDIIDSEIDQYYDYDGALKQGYIPSLTVDNIKQVAGVDLSTVIHSYDIRKIQDLRCVNYRLIYEMCYCDENWFKNGSIRDAQEKFLTIL